MRITQTRLIEIASTSIARARDKTGEASQKLSSGTRVAKPSDDPASWATGMAAKAAATMNGAHAKTIQRSQQRMTQADTALSSIHDRLLAAHDLAVQLATDTYSASDRGNAVADVRAMLADVQARLNEKSTSDGEYIFAGDAGTAPPFDATGAYVGGPVSRRVEVAQGNVMAMGVDASSLGSGAGNVDLVGAFDRFATALANNDTAGIEAAIDELDTGASRVADLRSTAGYSLAALDHAEESRSDVELNLKNMQSKMLEADPIAAATELAQAQSAFDAAGAVAQRIIAMLKQS